MEEDLGCWCGCAAARAGSLGTQVGQRGQAWVAAPGSLGDPGDVLGGAAQAQHLAGGLQAWGVGTAIFAGVGRQTCGNAPLHQTRSLFHPANSQLPWEGFCAQSVFFLS